MFQWNCCRTCLCEESLSPIFSLPEHHEKYTNIVYIATGIKIDINDNLPKEMCSNCINFINDAYKFRKKCDETQKLLQTKLEEKQHCIKVEIQPYNGEQTAVLDITDLLPPEDDYKDYEENVNEYDNKSNPIEEQVEETEFVTRVQDIVDKPIEIIFNNRKKGRSKEKAVKKRVKEDKKEVKKSERVKEEIECEYCHKILTSKLSIRNHYKIHTGFDVVCEHCGKKFITRRLLLMHCRAKHGYEKTDKCSYCDYRASNAEQVKIHERLHTGERPYVCKECNAGFHRKSSYLQHVAIHLPEKTVQCDQCSARFKSVTLMRIHKSRHRPPQYSFKCRVCDNSFARRRNVARHLQRIHGLPPDQEHIDRLKIA
ncbi:gastrula zinc finger protein XlCGF17.1 [Manduca sexta]|uniref:gastrula zinc finger protein XlCGF17.1 n=1 Tax=Manduca sexta TaxID=7130 RepID=UPI0018908B8E|nr:gastrula zinc finger protein XlCGF17.1 [Manduca sexta]